MTILERYTHALRNIPAPGGGGCHPYLLRVANYGIMAGIPDYQIARDIRFHLPSGARAVSDLEIQATIMKARNSSARPLANRTHRPVRRTIKPRPAYDGGKMATVLIEKGDGVDEEALRALSPVSIPEQPQDHAVLLLEELFDDNDMLCLGNKFSKAVSPVSEWKQSITVHGTNHLPHISPNPFTGREHLTKSNSLSRRCDAAVKEYRMVVAEFDDLSHAEQLAFWSAIPLPIAALIDSGGKSIHAWLWLDGISTPDDWIRSVKRDLYERRLVPMGVDRACSNPSRLSRLPGHYRSNTGKWQRLLYLNPTPSPVAIIDERISSVSKNKAK